MRPLSIRRWLVVFTAIGFVFLFSQCSKETVAPPATETDVVMLAHKGGGDMDYNPNFMDNTVPAVKSSVAKLPGVEVDIQMSLDGTIWLFHDGTLSRLTTTKANRYLFTMKDAEISKLVQTNGIVQDRLYKLSELLNYRSTLAKPFYVSLHVKTDFSADTLNLPFIGGEAAYLSRLADNLVKVLPSVSVPGTIFVEVYDATFCKKVKSLIPGIKVCLIKEVTFPIQVRDAVNLGYDGISSIFTEPTMTKELVDNAKSAGLIVQLWTPNTKEELDAAFAMHPTTIQTGNLEAMSLLNVVLK
ncbi:MAG: hypothetical protein LWW85_07685 [Marinilabiliales bacterium]|nr:hypothetical protein [Marinilabiliales bacterium]